MAVQMTLTLKPNIYNALKQSLLTQKQDIHEENNAFPSDHCMTSCCNMINNLTLVPSGCGQRITNIFAVMLQAVNCKGQHSISYTLSRNQTVVVEYSHDKDTDMFQVKFANKIDASMR